MCIYKWMKIKISKLPFITFLKFIKYICYTVFVTWCHIRLKISMEPSPYTFENINGTKPQIEGTVRHATSIRS